MKKYVLIFLLFTLFTATTSNAMEDRKETTYIIIHHSAGISGNVEAFRKDHKKRLDDNGENWKDIGYHFVITNGNGGLDGEIQIGRPIKKVGSHAKGRNHDSVGICLVGVNVFTKKQIESAADSIAALCYLYNIDMSSKTVQRHSGSCPGKGLNLTSLIEQSKIVLDKYKKSHPPVGNKDFKGSHAIPCEPFHLLIIRWNRIIIYQIFCQFFKNWSGRIFSRVSFWII